MSFKKALSFLPAMALCLCSTANAQAHAPVVIYHDSLASGWADWSWSTDRDLASTKLLHEGKDSISVTSKAWGTFALHSDNQSTAGLSTISFWVNGGDTGGQQLNLILNGEAGIHSNVKLPPLTKGWQHLEYPLAKLGVAANAPLTLIWIQNYSNDPAATFYIDDIKLM